MHREEFSREALPFLKNALINLGPFFIIFGAFVVLVVEKNVFTSKLTD
jgi:hypothetical protein